MAATRRILVAASSQAVAALSDLVCRSWSEPHDSRRERLRQISAVLRSRPSRVGGASQQASRARCAYSARLLAGQPPLPFGAKELDAARACLAATRLTSCVARTSPAGRCCGRSWSAYACCSSRPTRRYRPTWPGSRSPRLSPPPAGRTEHRGRPAHGDRHHRHASRGGHGDPPRVQFGRPGRIVGARESVRPGPGVLLCRCSR